LMAGPVCSGFLLPPRERYATANVVPRVAMASYGDVSNCLLLLALLFGAFECAM
jgi:hypothetical protein